MKLRNFLYLNTKIVEEYIAAIDGYTYDEESQTVAEKNEKSIEGKGNVGVVSGNGSLTGKREDEVKRTVKISDAAKFDKIYKYLKSNEDEELQYFEFMTDEYYNRLRRDDFLEVLVSARFSKMKELSAAVRKIAELASTIQPFTEQLLLDKKAEEAVKGFAVLEQLRSGKAISCVFEFEDKKFPLVAYLDESFFRCNQDNFVGESYLLCKVIRKIPKGKNVKLDEVFEDVKNLPLNREQRRSMPPNIDNPAEISDVIKGPAVVGLPVAVYQ